MLVLQPSPSDLAMVETDLTGLQPFTVYECSVFANTGAGWGPESETRVTMTTKLQKLVSEGGGREGERGKLVQLK